MKLKVLSLMGLFVAGALFACAEVARPADMAGQAETTISVRPDGSILKNDKPFFPFGFYHISWAKGGTFAQRMQDLTTLGNGGFNTILTEPINDDDQVRYTTFLTAAQQQGISVLSYGLKEDTVKRIAKNPAVLGFVLADDSNRSTTPAAILQRQQAFRKMAPDKLTYISLSVGYGRPETAYFGVSDLVGNQSYPVGDDNINVVYNVMRQTVTAAGSRHVTPIANLQTFAWPASGLYPSGAELTNMTYQALMAGVKGVLFYAFRAPEGLVTDQAPTWQVARQLASQVAVLAPTLLDGQRTELASGRGGLPVVVMFRGPASTYLLALNNSRSAWQTVKVNLPMQAGALTPMFGGASGLRLNGQSVMGRLAPLDVQVYTVQR